MSELLQDKSVSIQASGLEAEFSDFARRYRGRNFFRELATLIARKTGVSYVLVGYPKGEDLSQIKSAVLYAGGKLIDNYEYSLYGTPCENVIGRNCCYYPMGIQAMFPTDKELQHLGIESYLGLPIFDENNRAVGLLALMDGKLIGNAASLESALQVLVPRIARELKKRSQEKPKNPNRSVA